MERVNALGRGMQLMLVGAVLLFVDLFLPWQKYTGPFAEDIRDFAEEFGISRSLSVTAWHGFGGWALGILTLVLIAWIVARLAAVEIPIPVSAAMTAGVVGFLIFAFAVLKNLIDDYSAWGSYAGVVLGAAIAVGAWMEIQEAGGVEHLKTQIPTAGAVTAAPAAPATMAGGAAPPSPPPPPSSFPPPPPPPPAPAPPPAADPNSPSERKD